jgi:hypothetical protein
MVETWQSTFSMSFKLDKTREEFEQKKNKYRKYVIVGYITSECVGSNVVFLCREKSSNLLIYFSIRIPGNVIVNP